jgi:proline dehydrogenase
LLTTSGTYQSYLNRQPGFLADALEHATKNGYQLGVKLVRGAYFVQERKKWIDEGRPGPDPIWIDKPATDKAFNDSVALLIGTMARQLQTSPQTALSVFFGTHNEESCQLIVETLKKEGLATKVKGGWALRDDVMGKVFIAQLYGKSHFATRSDDRNEGRLDRCECLRVCTWAYAFRLEIYRIWQARRGHAFPRPTSD